MSKEEIREKGAEQPELRAEKPIRRRFGFWRILLVVLVLLALLLLVCVKLFPGAFDFARLVRTFRYMGLRDQAGYGQITFDPNPVNTFAAFGDGLLVGGENSVTLTALDGEQKAFAQGPISNPVLVCGAETAVCFSPGDSYLVVLDSDGAILEEQTEAGAFLDADVSADGYLCTVTSESGYKSVSAVKNPNQEVVFRFSSRTRYLNACAVPEGGKLLAVASLGEEDGVYRSELILLDTGKVVNDLEKDPAVIRADLGNQVIYELKFLDRSHICAIGEDDIRFLNTKGELISSLSLAEQQLLDYSFNGEGRLTAALGQGTTGERSLVLTLDAEGSETARREYADHVRSLSSAGDYTAVLTDLYMDLLNQKLEPYRKSWQTGGTARSVMLRPDGTAFLIGTSSASLYIPD